MRPPAPHAAVARLDAQPCASGERHRANQPVLEIGGDVFPDEAVQGLLEHWIVPLVVDSMIEAILERRSQQ